ncbi:MAG: hypothetical protein JNK57_15625 [Planctomycetaceae bacterium]|nr:hypothetical protein [Planctomycetaceae bacterium]
MATSTQVRRQVLTDSCPVGSSTNPLTVEEFLRDPLQRTAGPLRVGIFRGSEIITLFSDKWGPTFEERRNLVWFLQVFEGEDLGDTPLGIFSDDGQSFQKGGR